MCEKGALSGHKVSGVRFVVTDGRIYTSSLVMWHWLLLLFAALLLLGKYCSSCIANECVCVSGASHCVDSTDLAFQLAGEGAAKQGNADNIADY